MWRPLRAVAEVESGSTFFETCLAREVRKTLTKPNMLHGTTPAETCFAAPLHTRFSLKFQRVTAASESFSSTAVSITNWANFFAIILNLYFAKLPLPGNEPGAPSGSFRWISVHSASEIRIKL